MAFEVNSGLSRWQRKASVLLFLIGVFSSTQVYLAGCIGISEIIIFAVAPLIFLKDYNQFRSDGFLTFFALIFFNMVGCVVASLINNVSWFAIIKGLMALYSMFAITVVLHKLLRGNLYGIRWFLLGVVISGVIKAFAFNPRVITSSSGAVTMGEEELETKIQHPLFWMGRLATVIQAVMCGWFFHVPIVLGYIMIFLYALVLVNVTVSGRAAIAVTFIGIVLLTFVGKSVGSLQRFKSRFQWLLLIMLSAGVLLKIGYGYLARSGTLGEKALVKYEQQTRFGSGVIDLLRSGRAEFFIGLSAIIDRPLVGFGSVPVDREGYVLEYISKYGTAEDYQNMIERNGYTYIDGVHLIPSHSYIVGFWLTNGISGLLLWIYVLKLIYDYYRRYISSLPQVAPYVCFVTPWILWNMFFSPYTNRFTIPLYVTCILLCKAAYKGIRVSDDVDMGLVDRCRR